jgi:hypothetical protein
MYRHGPSPIASPSGIRPNAGDNLSLDELSREVTDRSETVAWTEPTVSFAGFAKHRPTTDSLTSRQGVNGGAFYLNVVGHGGLEPNSYAMPGVHRVVGPCALLPTST